MTPVLLPDLSLPGNLNLDFRRRDARRWETAGVIPSSRKQGYLLQCSGARDVDFLGKFLGHRVGERIEVLDDQ